MHLLYIHYYDTRECFSFLLSNSILVESDTFCLARLFFFTPHTISCKDSDENIISWTL